MKPTYNEIDADIRNYYYGENKSEYLNDEERHELLARLDELEDDANYDEESEAIIADMTNKVLARIND